MSLFTSDDLRVSHGPSPVVPTGFQSRALHPAMSATSMASSTEALPVAVLRATWRVTKRWESVMPNQGGNSEIYGHLGSPDLDRCSDLHISCIFLPGSSKHYIQVYIGIYIYIHICCAISRSFRL